MNYIIHPEIFVIAVSVIMMGPLLSAIINQGNKLAFISKIAMSILSCLLFVYIILSWNDIKSSLVIYVGSGILAFFWLSFLIHQFAVRNEKRLPVVLTLTVVVMLAWILIYAFVIG